MNLCKPTVLFSKNLNPFFNLSCGKYIIDNMRKENFQKKVLFLSTSHQGVFIGINQNCWKECNINEMKKDNVPLVRRDTGGGCNYVDLGNLLFSFMHDLNGQDVNCNYPIILNALNKLNINAHQKGRNDICVNDKKISGSAFTLSNNFIRHHGTMLINVDKEKLSRYLNPNKLKLESKGIKSNMSRIINLTELDNTINHDKMTNALIDSFSESQKESIDIREINYDNIKNKKMFDNIYNNFHDNSFIYNRNPEFTVEFENRFTFGTTQILLNVINNKVNSVNMYSDSLNYDLIHYLQDYLNKILINKDFNISLFTDINSYKYQTELLEIVDFITKKLNNKF